MVGSPSGTGKSGVFDRIINPLREFEIILAQYWSADTQPTVKAAQVRCAEELKRLKRKLGSELTPDDEAEVQRQIAHQIHEQNTLALQASAPTLICDNCTSEALADILSRNKSCAAQLSADARDIVDLICGRYGKGPDDALHLKAFSEDDCRFDRSTSDSIVLRKPHLTCLWCVQPDKLEHLFSKRFATEGGLLARFLVCQCRCNPMPIDREQVAVTADHDEAWETFIYEVANEYRVRDEPLVITPSAKAISILDRYHAALIEKRTGEWRNIDSFVARWNEQAWRIALVLHVGEWGGNAHEHPLSLVSAENAIRITNWFARHQLEILTINREAQADELERKVAALCRDKPSGISARDVQRKNIFRTAPEAHRLLENLKNQGVLKSENVRPSGGGKVTRIYKLI